MAQHRFANRLIITAFSKNNICLIEFAYFAHNRSAEDLHTPVNCVGPVQNATKTLHESGDHPFIGSESVYLKSKLVISVRFIVSFSHIDRKMNVLRRWSNGHAIRMERHVTWHSITTSLGRTTASRQPLRWWTSGGPSALPTGTWSHPHLCWFTAGPSWWSSLLLFGVFLSRMWC